MKASRLIAAAASLLSLVFALNTDAGLVLELNPGDYSPTTHGWTIAAGCIATGSPDTILR
ncbi:MAG: hypothetical protein WCK89_22890 [bacterium]